MESLFLDLVKAWGAPALFALLLWWQLDKAERRETLKDMRIQLLENKLVESLDERIVAADQMATALISSTMKSQELVTLVNQLMEIIKKRRH